jgi:hypothetical protein
VTYYVYGAVGSKATEKAELLLNICRRQYKLFILGEDYTVAQLQKLVPNTTFVPHIYHNLNYIGGINELHDYLYDELRIEKS